MFLGIAIVVGLVFTVPTMLFAMIGVKRPAQLVTGGVVTLILLTLFNWLVLYKALPTVGFSITSFYQSFWLWALNLIAAAIIIGLFSVDWSDTENPSAGMGLVALFTVGVLLFGTIQLMGGIWTQGRATTLAKLANNTEAPVGQYPDSDAEHLMQVPPETADELAKNAMSNSQDRNLSTFYERGDRTEQSIDDHRYYLYPLHPRGYRESGQSRGGTPVYEIPGFIVVDAENPNAQGQVRMANEQGQQYSIKYTPGSVFSYNLERHLWTHDYRGVVVSDLTLEVDDDWNPYFTGSKDQRTYNFQQTVPNRLITVNAQTGEINEYGLDELPPWVDRVYSASTVEAMLNWWGEWGAGAPYKLIGNARGNKFKVAETEDPTLVYTKGGYPAWQAVMTSHNNDSVASYLALFEARSNKVTMYPIEGLQLEGKAIQTVSSAAQASRMTVRPVDPAVHSIYGHLSWVMPLVGEGNVYQGMAFMLYNDPSGSSVAIGRTLGEALTIYRQKLAQPAANGSPQENANQRTTEGTVTELTRQVENGQTIVYFRLDGNQERGYRIAATPDNLELTFLGVGDRARIIYIDPGPETKRVDVGSLSVVAESQLQPIG